MNSRIKLSAIKVGIVFLPVLLGKILQFAIGAAVHSVSYRGGNEIHDLAFAIGMWIATDGIIIIGTFISIMLWIKYVHKSDLN